MRNSISPVIFSGDVKNMSSVLFTEPSVEFSIGTTPKVGNATFDFLETLRQSCEKAMREPNGRNV